MVVFLLFRRIKSRTTYIWSYYLHSAVPNISVATYASMYYICLVVLLLAISSTSTTPCTSYIWSYYSRTLGRTRCIRYYLRADVLYMSGRTTYPRPYRIFLLLLTRRCTRYAWPYYLQPSVSSIPYLIHLVVLLTHFVFTLKHRVRRKQFGENTH